MENSFEFKKPKAIITFDGANLILSRGGGIGNFGMEKEETINVKEIIDVETSDPVSIIPGFIKFSFKWKNSGNYVFYFKKNEQEKVNELLQKIESLKNEYLTADDLANIESVKAQITEEQEQKEQERLEAKAEAKVEKDLHKATRTLEKSGAICPKCHSEKVMVLGRNNKQFSTGKALTGAALFGWVGATAGLMGKKGKFVMVCQSCGNKYKVNL